jgi:hypothetical protein
MYHILNIKNMRKQICTSYKFHMNVCKICVCAYVYIYIHPYIHTYIYKDTYAYKYINVYQIWKRDEFVLFSKVFLIKMKKATVSRLNN